VKQKFVTLLTLLSWIQVLAALPAPEGKSSSGLSPNSKIEFSRDIRPIFADHCFECHGPEKQKSGFRLDLKEKAMAGGDTGKAIVPGKSTDSLLYRYIAGLHADTRMPPKGKPLTPNQVAQIGAWIDAGAVWPSETAAAITPTNRLWSLKRPERSAIPQVRNVRWLSNPIDSFVLAKLESANISPSPEADRVTLIRRLSLDLTGLPPIPEQVSSFASDRRPDAYERLVDSLLASPHFGERWGRHWLDLARYADSEGYQIDHARPYAYVYRNWVIDAFNRDLPFDRFTIEQLAGDLFPNATTDQKIASGFHRNTLMNFEDGVDREEFRCKAKSDRVATTGTVWLGLTLGCAECHSHKYDPITQKEFYQFYAFFNNAVETDFPAPQPYEAEAYAQRRKAWDAETTRLRSLLAEYSTNQVPVNQSNWEKTIRLPATRWTVLEPAKVSSTEGTGFRTDKDKSVKAVGRAPAYDTYVIDAKTDLKGITAFRLEIPPGSGRKAARPGQFILSEFSVEIQQGKDAPRRVLLQKASADLSLPAAPVEDAIDGVATNGWRAGAPLHRHVAVFETREDLDCSGGSHLTFKLVQQGGWQMTIGRFRLSATTSPRPHNANLLPDLVVQSLETPASARTGKQKEELMRYYLEEIDPVSKRLNEKLEQLTKAAPEYKEPQAPGFQQSPTNIPTFIHVRGDFLRKGEQVQPGVLAALHPFHPRGEIPDRLDLAQWLVDPANPLTARVAVNHLWQHLFGRGLVASSEDFGVRGEPPSHPDLLDWLATEFIRVGWSRKEMIKLIVGSTTYRQSAAVREELASSDPNNILLARQNRFRLESEIVRDLYLACGGLLKDDLKGPSFRPWTSDNFKALGGAGAFTWTDSEGPEKYRRGLYVFTQRTVPYPVSATFDAANPNETCPRRENSNTPLQALTLLNHPVFSECAQGLGRRMFLAESANAADRISYGFELCLGRKPSPAELARLQQLFNDERRLANNDRNAAAKIVGEVEVDQTEIKDAAGLILVAQVLMNLDEFLTRE